MIYANDSNSILDRTNLFIGVFTWEGDQHFDQLKNSFKRSFPNKECYYVAVDNSKGKGDKKEPTSNELLKLTNNSLTVFGRWKDRNELHTLTSDLPKVVVYFCTEESKLVNKLSTTIQNAISVGYRNEKLINFDVAFSIDSMNENTLLIQAEKYLKKLSYEI